LARRQAAPRKRGGETREAPRFAGPLAKQLGCQATRLRAAPRERGGETREAPRFAGPLAGRAVR